MEPLIEHSTVAAGFRTRVLELERAGPGLVLLHGWGDFADVRRLLPELQTPPADLAAIGCPVLLVWSTRDRMVPHTGARVLLEAPEGTEVELLDGVGHRPHLEATDRLAELVLRFIISRDGSDPDAG